MFVKDFTIVLLAAGTVCLLCNLLRIPVFLGYLVAGVLIGPHVIAPSWVSNGDNILQLSDMGVIFLMFYAGMAFDVDKLRRVLAPAVGAIGFQTLAMIVLGVMSAGVLGWTSTEGLFFGGILATSSTMVTVQILQARDAFKLPHGQMALGITILEDVVSILLLVVLTGVAVKGHFEWGEVWQVSFLVGVFVVMVFFLGKLVAPPLLRLVGRVGNAETLALIIVAFALGVGQLAAEFRFSVALGAFLAGSILSSSRMAPQIESATESLRNVFIAVFFVAVGMQIEIGLVVAYWLPILVLTGVTVVAKVVTCWLGICLSGQSSQAGFRAAMCKAHIGEFCFVIVALGQALGVTSPALSAVTVGTALLTISIAPALNFVSRPVHEWLVRRTPTVVIGVGEFYQNLLGTVRMRLAGNGILHLLKRPLLQILGYFLMFNGTVLLAWMGAREAGSYGGWAAGLVWGGAALVCLIPLIAILRNMDAILMLVTEAAFGQGSAQDWLQGRRRHVLHTAMLSLILVLFASVYFSAASAYFPSGVALGLYLLLIVGVGAFFWKRLIHLNSRIETLFVDSFQERVKGLGEMARESARRAILEQYPWPIHVEDVAIEEGSEACGRRILDLGLREHSQAIVAAVSRRGYTHYDPSPQTPLFPGDHLILVGEEPETKRAAAFLQRSVSVRTEDLHSETFSLERFFVSQTSPLNGDTLAGANIRRRFGVSIYGIQRGELKRVTPGAEEILHAGDVLLAVGHPENLAHFRRVVEC